MKSGVFWIAFLLIIASALATYDFSHHENGHELTETLLNEPQSIFVIFFFKDSTDQTKAKKVADLRAEIRQKLLGQDVYYTEVDMSDAEKAKSYAEVTKILGIDAKLVDNSPVIAMAYNRSGYWIHGEGVPKETAETVQSFVRVQEKEAKKSGSSPVSFGGASRHSSDKQVSVGGYNAGGPNY